MSDQKKPRRKKFVPLKPMRLATSTYKLPGAYAITICTKKRKKLFNIPALRSILYEEWTNLPQHFPGIVAGTFMVMHDHLHCILILKQGIEQEKSVRQIIGGYKSIVANAWLRHLSATGANYPGDIWQSRFYDHIIRDEADFKAQTAYILNNPRVYKAKQSKARKNKDKGQKNV
ncbi:transposase [Dictyobacter kobayashii]|uniref:Transposase IS200-like domain-containing protein n=1 Tax=Dictyobacter kobayashii TaxID=2014872 RepID=A0A402AYS7_9CHLR|nr:transposase [Dictyobacter kobayashii]GCE24269.1 hypothetical protein KDK_80690 [Dictyobacter kobayashii]